MPISEPIAPGYPMHNAEKQRMTTMIIVATIIMLQLILKQLISKQNLENLKKIQEL